jgi:hypothetical protein
MQLRTAGKRGLGAAIAVTICVILLYFAPLRASTITQTLYFPTPEVAYDGGACLVTLAGTPSLGNPGEPLLPVHSLQILLPQGEEVVGVKTNISQIQEMRIGAPVEYARQQVRLSQAPPTAATLRDDSIYGGAGPFPANRAVHVTTQTCRGYNIAFINVYPVAYVPLENTLLAASSMEIVVETAPSARMLQRSMATLRAGSARDAAVVSRMVDDAGAEATYVSGAPLPVFSSFVEPEDTYPYVIITSYAFKDLFEPLKAYKDSTGLRTKIVHTGEINYYYTGADLQEKIRNFIKDAYANWDTEYVLLGADEEWIRHRGLYATASGDVDLDIASDLYYGALDGTWNDDSDAYWGEPGEEDLIPDVCVGRLPVGSAEEVAACIDKILKYERSPVADQVQSALCLGEIIAGGTYGASYMNETRDGSTAHGFSTAGLDGGFVADTLYDRDFYPAEWDKDDLVPLLNSGRHLVNHIGHCSMYTALKLYNDDVDTCFTNDGDSTTYFILYTQGCYAGSFDNRDTDGTHVFDDCIAERLIYNEHGAVAFIGNTRFGYYSAGNTRGASQFFHRQFVDAVFGEGITAIGKANDDSRVDNAAYIDFEAMRWVYYDLVLLGDPSMDIWTAAPESLAVTHPDTVYAYENEVEIDVSGGAGPLAGARVSLFTDDSFSPGYTDGGGTCVLDPMSDAPCDLYVSVAAHNFYSYIDTIAVVPASGPLVTFEGFTTDDDTTGASSGNSNGEVDAGETIESVVTLRNAGQDTAYYVTARISTANPYVYLIDSTGVYGDMPPGGVTSPSWSFAYYVSPACPDSEIVPFDMLVDYGDTSVVRHFAVTARAPVLRLAGISLADTLYGNGNGCIEAGETFEVVFGYENTGSAEAVGVGIKIGESDLYAAINLDSAYIDTVAVDSTRLASPSFVITLSPDCPEFHELVLDITISFASGRQAQDSTVLYVGGSLEDDFEGGNRGWTHDNLWPLYADDWHLSDYMNHTPSGTYSWKFGGVDSGKYSNFSYGALVTPELCLAGNATLSFWHWIKVEMLSQTYAWDGAIVEISTDGGGTWTRIAPIGGYPNKIYGDSHCPLPANTPCFGTNSGWTEVTFDLSAYEGSARIRFVLASGAFYTSDGWYIDDLTITDDAASVDIDPDGLRPDRFSLHALAPNPVSSRAAVAFDVPAASRVTVEVFNVEGRLVDTITDATYQPGRHSLEWKAGRLSPGVYFVNMEARDFHETRKIIIVK